jgi:hypothetical protein
MPPATFAASIGKNGRSAWINSYSAPMRRGGLRRCEAPSATEKWKNIKAIQAEYFCGARMANCCRNTAPTARILQSFLIFQSDAVETAALWRSITMIKLTTALLTLGISMATVPTVIAQRLNECFYGSCNPEAPWCRVLCGSDSQYENVRSGWNHRHAKHHHHTNHHKGRNSSR